MSYLKIPQSTSECIIIPSAPEGGFFDKPRFNEEFLQSRITKREFDLIINKFSDILMHAYATKRALETRDITPSMLTLLFIGFFVLISSFVLIFEGVVNKIMWLEILGFTALLLSLVVSAIPYITYIRNRIEVFPTFESLA